MADAAPGRADHLRQCLLVDLRYDLLLSYFFPIVGQQQKRACQPLLARIEQVIDQGIVQTHVLSQKVRHEKVAKSMVVVHGADDAGLFHPHHDAISHGRGRGNAQRLDGQAALAAQITDFKDRDDRFLALFGDDRELHFALLLALTSVKVSSDDGKLLNVMRPMVERELIEQRDRLMVEAFYCGARGLLLR